MKVQLMRYQPASDDNLLSRVLQDAADLSNHSLTCCDFVILIQIQTSMSAGYCSTRVMIGDIRVSIQ